MVNYNKEDLMAERNEFGLYDEAVLHPVDQKREQSRERFAEQLQHGAFVMTREEALEAGFLTTNADLDRSEYLKTDDDIPLSTSEAQGIGIVSPSTHVTN